MKKSKWDIAHIDMRTAPVKKDKEKGFFKWLKRNWKRILIINIIIYLHIIGYGALTTRFYENEAGEKVAYRMSFSDLKKQDDYKDLKVKLTDIRNLLRDITIVDIHLANGEYTNYEAATLYTKILDEKLDVLIPKVNSMNLEDEQASIQKELESILSYDLALYLQNIAKGLQSGSTATVQTALAYREKALGTYQIIESDIKEIAESLKIKDTEFYEWTLNSAVLEKDETATLRQKEGNGNE